MNNKDAELENYLYKKNKLEKIKYKRISIAILIFACIICVFTYNYLGKDIDSFQEFLFYAIILIIISIIDICIHLAVFKFTIYKNYEDSIKLEKEFEKLIK